MKATQTIEDIMKLLFQIPILHKIEVINVKYMIKANIVMQILGFKRHLISRKTAGQNLGALKKTNTNAMNAHMRIAHSLFVMVN